MRRGSVFNVNKKVIIFSVAMAVILAIGVIGYYLVINSNIETTLSNRVADLKMMLANISGSDNEDIIVSYKKNIDTDSVDYIFSTDKDKKVYYGPYVTTDSSGYIIITPKKGKTITIDKYENEQWVTIKKDLSNGKDIKDEEMLKTRIVDEGRYRITAGEKTYYIFKDCSNINTITVRKDGEEGIDTTPYTYETANGIYTTKKDAVIVIQAKINDRYKTYEIEPKMYYTWAKNMNEAVKAFEKVTSRTDGKIAIGQSKEISFNKEDQSKNSNIRFGALRVEGLEANENYYLWIKTVENTDGKEYVNYAKRSTPFMYKSITNPNTIKLTKDNGEECGSGTTTGSDVTVSVKKESNNIESIFYIEKIQNSEETYVLETNGANEFTLTHSGNYKITLINKLTEKVDGVEQVIVDVKYYDIKIDKSLLEEPKTQDVKVSYKNNANEENSTIYPFRWSKEKARFEGPYVTTESTGYFTITPANGKSISIDKYVDGKWENVEKKVTSPKEGDEVKVRIVDNGVYRIIADYRTYIICKGASNVDELNVDEVGKEGINNTPYTYKTETGYYTTKKDAKIIMQPKIDEIYKRHGIVPKVYYTWAKNKEEAIKAFEKVSTRVDGKIAIGESKEFKFDKDDQSKNLQIEFSAINIEKLEANKEYYLWIKTVEDGKYINYARKNIPFIYKTITKSNTIKLTKSNGKECSSGSITGSDVTVSVKKESNNVESTFYIEEIKDGEEKYVLETNGANEFVLTHSGDYKITLINKLTEKVDGVEQVILDVKYYYVKIDKNNPGIYFEEKSEEWKKEGKIVVKIEKGNEDWQSEINKDNMKYYWTQSTKTPSKSDFEGTTENGVRGTIKNTIETISAPSEGSGVWYLWVYAEDKAGNYSIKSNVIITDESNSAYIDREAPIAGKLEIKYGEELKDYTITQNENKVNEGNFVNEDIYISLQSGYDAHSGVKEDKLSIKKDNKKIDVKKEGQYYKLIDSGVYSLTVTTVDKVGNSSTREYIVKIDKDAPIISFGKANKDYKKEQSMEVTINDANGIGVEEKVEYVWIGYNPSEGKINSREELIKKYKEIKETEEEKFDEALAEAGIKIKTANANDIKVNDDTNVRTVAIKEETGIYYLWVKSVKDKLGNSENSISKEAIYIDNTKPTVPIIGGAIEKLVGTKTKYVKYYGETTNEDVIVIAVDSYSLSGVDKYEFKKTTDGGRTWTEWVDATCKENNETIGKVTITEHGKTIIKFRSISVLKDGTLESEETEECIVMIDKIGPEVTFANESDNKNGSEDSTEGERVRVTVTDGDEIISNSNMLKYSWVKFETKEEFNTFKERNHNFDELKNRMTNANAFVNGAVIPTMNEDGIYSLFIYAEDNYGNSIVTYSNYYEVKISKTNEIEELTILPNTKVKDFIDNIKDKISSTKYEVFDKNANILKETDFVTTNSILRVDNQKEYRIIAVGDLNGDGKMTGIDLSRMRLYQVNEIELEEPYQKACDINRDGKISGSDLSKMRLVLVGLNILEL